MDTEKVTLGLCIDNEGCEDLEVRKIYEVLSETAENDDYVRVIDESGEVYLYPASCFFAVETTHQVREPLFHAA